MPWPSTETVFLIGFMGTGKSTVGARLAERANRSFVDLDAQIEREAGKNVREIFAHEGEPAFRAREAAALRNVPAGAVIAVGGGAPCFGQNLDWMLAHGRVIGLVATADEILRRVGDPASRPLLARATDMRGEVDRLLAARRPFYERAHHTIETSGQTPQEVVEAIERTLAC